MVGIDAGTKKAYAITTIASAAVMIIISITFTTLGSSQTTTSTIAGGSSLPGQGTIPGNPGSTSLNSGSPPPTNPGTSNGAGGSGSNLVNGSLNSNNDMIWEDVRTDQKKYYYSSTSNGINVYVIGTIKTTEKFHPGNNATIIITGPIKDINGHEPHPHNFSAYFLQENTDNIFWSFNQRIPFDRNTLPILGQYEVHVTYDGESSPSTYFNLDDVSNWWDSR